MRWEMVYQGTVDAISVRPAELLRPAVLDNVPAVLLLQRSPVWRRDAVARRHPDDPTYDGCRRLARH